MVVLQVSSEIEGQLKQRLLAKDPESLAYVYDQFYSPVYRYVSFRINDKQTVEDLTSDVFTRLLASLDKGRVPDKLKGWLFAVANNAVIDHYRKSGRIQWSGITEDMASSAESPAAETDKSLLNDMLREGLHKLNPNQQHVLALRFGYGMPLAEVAEQMDKSVGAVKMLQARAIAALAKEVSS